MSTVSTESKAETVRRAAALIRELETELWKIATADWLEETAYYWADTPVTGRRAWREQFRAFAVASAYLAAHALVQAEDQ